MVKVLFDYGDSINNSINQLKAVRGYYFYTIANDSNTPNRIFSKDYYDKGIVGQSAFIGLDAYAWSAEKTTNDQKPKGSCVKVPGFLGNEVSGDECFDPVIDDNKTQFIRSFSGFGVCTGSWNNISAADPLYALSWTSAASIPCVRFASQ